jgi:hypothetical protein
LALLVHYDIQEVCLVQFSRRFSWRCLFMHTHTQTNTHSAHTDTQTHIAHTQTHMYAHVPTRTRRHIHRHTATDTYTPTHRDRHTAKTEPETEAPCSRFMYRVYGLGSRV